MATQSAVGGRRRESLWPGTVNALLALALLILVATVALIAHQDSPPAVAEFAPQDQQRIKDPNQAQTSNEGTSLGERVDQSVAPSPTPSGLAALLPSALPIDLPSVKHCVGDPPRQTEDPQSPPCVAYWQGNNGGATYKGVTATTINLVYPPTLSNAAEIHDFQEYFNRRYEFYGRRIQMVGMKVSYSQFAIADTSPQGQQNAAVAADSEAHAFASLTFPYAHGSDQIYDNALASRGIMSTVGSPTQDSEADIGSKDPYRWATLAPLDKDLRAQGALVCTTLNHQAPRFAPPQVSANYPTGIPTRRFGLVVTKNAGVPLPDTQPLTDAMKACGAPLVYQHDFEQGTSTEQQDSDSMVVGMISQDVTTVLCVCEQNVLIGDLFPSATKQHRNFEWIVDTYLHGDQSMYYSTQAPDQFPGMIGLSWYNKRFPAEQTPWFEALREMDPSIQTIDYLQWSTDYSDMLLLASGIQLAGPNLNPTTFRTGLMRARFANPGAGTAPFYQARVGFSPGDHAMYEDVALIHWNSTGSDPTVPGSAPGAFCYAQSGIRYTASTMPSSDHVFDVCN